jgi:acyl-CoA reductase-like NAD-dependent aldehyde dehydrogenase
MQNYKMWIGGQFVNAESGQTLPVINPATGEEFARIPLGGKAEVDKAVTAARQALPVWSKKTQAERSAIMLQIAGVIKEHAGELTELETRDHGFPLNIAQATVMGAVRDFEYTAANVRLLAGEVIPNQVNSHVYLQREPRGVAAIITPWNVPLNILSTKLAFSLVVGNTCVVKPASVDSLAALRFAELLDSVGLPPGTVNVITGPGATIGEALSSHPGVNMVSFTGSCETGKAIMSAASGTVKHLILELGGKNPFIVMEDADLDKAAFAGVMSVIFNTGQVCASSARFYIQAKVYDEFAVKFVAGMKKIVVGDPLDKNTFMGPAASAEHRDKIEAYIQSGIAEGAKLALGGKRPSAPPLDKGFYVLPTVFTNVTQNMKIAREEIFGPVGVLIKFSSEEEVIALANDTTYGLSASVWTRDTARGIRIANEIQAGSVWVNGTAPPSPEIPWGGYKQSGIGKENAKQGLEGATNLKVIGVSLG